MKSPDSRAKLLGSPTPGFESMDWLFDLSLTISPHFENENNNEIYLLGFVRIKWDKLYLKYT